MHIKGENDEVGNNVVETTNKYQTKETVVLRESYVEQSNYTWNTFTMICTSAVLLGDSNYFQLILVKKPLPCTQRGGKNKSLFKQAYNSVYLFTGFLESSSQKLEKLWAWLTIPVTFVF